MTEKQLAEVFKKFGMEKYDPINEPFDPNTHNAMFQVADASKPEGTVAHVLKVKYMKLLLCFSPYCIYNILVTNFVLAGVKICRLDTRCMIE